MMLQYHHTNGNHDFTMMTRKSCPPTKKRALVKITKIRGTTKKIGDLLSNYYAYVIGGVIL